MKKLILALIMLATVNARAELKWLTDLEDAQKVAAKDNKKILVDFTGSDWCGFCIKLHKEVFETREFQKFAKDYVLVELDFPKTKKQNPALKTKNDAAKSKFEVRGFPTVIILSSSGEELARRTGYGPGTGPEAYLANLTGSSSKDKPPAKK